jgi:hypothetical protein
MKKSAMKLCSRGKYNMLSSRLKITVCTRQFTSPMNYRHPSTSKRSTLPTVFTLEPAVGGLLSVLTNKPNVKDAKMNVSSFTTREYAKVDIWLNWKNKPNSNPIKPNFKRKANPAVRCSNTVSHELIAPILPLYKPSNDWYYSRRNCRCSSMVEHSFRKAEVEGSTPSIGFVNLKSVICLKSSE